MRVTLIHNPKAGDDSKPGADELVAMLREAGHVVRYQSAKERKWSAALDEPADLIAVAGGDGTIGKVAKRMLGRRIALAILPTGTANNIAVSLGLTQQPLAQQIASWRSGRRVGLDVGIATGPWGSKYFIEGFGIGLLPSHIPEADASPALAEINQAQAVLDHVLDMLSQQVQHLPAVKVNARLDGCDISGDYLLFEAMNMQFVGPNLNLAPHGDYSDGLLEAVLIRENKREELANYFSCGQECRTNPPELPSRQGRQLEIEWSGFDVHIDDKVWSADDLSDADDNRIEVTIEANALNVLLPA